MFIVFLLLIISPLVFAWNDCPKGITNDPAPGICRLYIDTDNNNICDYSESAPTSSRKTPTLPPKDSATKVITPSASKLVESSSLCSTIVHSQEDIWDRIFKLKNIVIFLLLTLSASLLFISKHPWLRIITLGIGLAYLGFYESVCLSPIGALQQSALNPSQLFSGPKIGWLILILLPLYFTLIFGRIYCGSVCPFGAVQEFIYRLGKRIRFNHQVNSKLDQIGKSIKYLVLLAIIISPLFITIPWYCQYDPFYYLFNFKGEMLSLIILVVLLISSLIISRPWCRYICPYGALLALVSKFSLLKIKTDKNACISCTICQKQCLMQAIEKGVINQGECIKCGECLASCPKKALNS